MHSPEHSMAPALSLRQPVRKDGAALYELIAACPPLDLNSRYAYMLLCEHFAQTCVIAEADGEVVGAVTGYVLSDRPDTLFIWQLAVAQPMRGQKLGRRMLEHLLQRCIVSRHINWLEATISPSNQASRKLFTELAARHGAGCTTSALFPANDFGESGHEEECLYRIGPCDQAL
jgi:L-2,4-diaminobutyric acid acetyltransferase